MCLLHSYTAAKSQLRFLVSFEKGTPAWDGYEFEYLKEYPSVKWKLLNLAKLAKQNPQKLALFYLLLYVINNTHRFQVEDF